MAWTRKNKYNRTKVDFHGRSFHSKLEAAVYGLLLLREKAGEITDIKCQVHVKFHTYKYGEVRMIPDFSAVNVEYGEIFYIEAKGFETRDWLRKRKAWLIGGPAKMEIYKGSYKYPKLIETLIPKGEE